MYIKERNNKSYLGTFVSGSKADINKYDEMVRTVALMNKQKVWGCLKNGEPIKMRLEKRGRKAITKMVVSKGWYTPGSKGPVSFDYFGNLVGGIKNAAEFDVYLYSR